MEKVSFETGVEQREWVMHGESGGDDDADDKLVRERWDDTDKVDWYCTTGD